MKITRDVVMDLLPLYASGEASADTRAVVEEFLEGDPELRRQVKEGGLDTLLATGAAASVPPDVELRALRRTRGLLRWQRLTYAWALTVSFLSLSAVISFEGGQVHFRLLLAGYPAIFIPCLILASSLWMGYFLLRRHTRTGKS
jgi:anti-sigma factor RsiW